MKMRKIFSLIVIPVFAAIMTTTTVFASTDNPMTGDEQGRYIGIVIAVAAVALVVIIVITAISSKKSGK